MIAHSFSRVTAALGCGILIAASAGCDPAETYAQDVFASIKDRALHPKSGSLSPHSDLGSELARKWIKVRDDEGDCSYLAATEERFPAGEVTTIPSNEPIASIVVKNDSSVQSQLSEEGIDFGIGSDSSFVLDIKLVDIGYFSVGVDQDAFLAEARGQILSGAACDAVVATDLIATALTIDVWQETTTTGSMSGAGLAFEGTTYSSLRFSLRQVWIFWSTLSARDLIVGGELEEEAVDG